MSNRIVHLITSTGVGGAEKHLLRLLSYESNKKHDFVVITLQGEGYLNSHLSALGISCYSLSLNIYNMWFIPFYYIYLLYKLKPRKLYSWLIHANLFSILTFFYIRKCKIVWNIRNSLDDYKKWPWSTRIALLFSTFFSKFPDAIFFNSERSLKQYALFGFSNSDLRVIYNFIPYPLINLDSFYPCRSDLNIPEESFLLGLFARNVPSKRAIDLLHITKSLVDKGFDVHSLFIGRDYEDPEFLSIIDALDLSDHVHLVSQVVSIEFYYKILDVFVLTSEAEGFPNVVAEAALMHVPIVSSNISDLDKFLPYPWQLVESGDISSFVDAILKIHNLTPVQIDKLRKLQCNSFKKQTNPHLVFDLFFNF